MATRAEQRAATTGRIMETARRHLADVGAAGLSLRSVAREVGMVSSAVYRYVESRDELLTRLIIEAYDSLGEAVEAAVATPAGDLDRWVAGAIALRDWSLRRPHEYLLLYGSPVPGYAAPTDTVQPGTRVIRALVSVVTGAVDGGRLESPPKVDDLPDELSDDLRTLADIAELPQAPELLLAVLLGWTQMFGLLGFELTNQTRGVVEHHEQLFVVCAIQTGRAVGLR
jgi:AcrR family transcriptional regulator